VSSRNFGGIVDASRPLREAADDRLGEPRWRAGGRRIVCAVDGREERRRCWRDFAVEQSRPALVLAVDQRVGLRPGQAEPLGQERGQERRAVLRTDHRVGIGRRPRVEERSRVEVGDAVEIGPRVADAVRVVELGGADQSAVALLRADEEDVRHAAT
jgi:hypothetical protein